MLERLYFHTEFVQWLSHFLSMLVSLPWWPYALALSMSHGAHPSASTDMHAFGRRYSPIERDEGGFKIEVEDLEASFRNAWLSPK